MVICRNAEAVLGQRKVGTSWPRFTIKLVFFYLQPITNRKINSIIVRLIYPVERANSPPPWQASRTRRTNPWTRRGSLASLDLCLCPWASRRGRLLRTKRTVTKSNRNALRCTFTIAKLMISDCCTF